MSAIFIEELGLPEPEYSRSIGSDPHGAQTGAMLVGSERVRMLLKLLQARQIEIDLPANLS